MRLLVIRLCFFQRRVWENHLVFQNLNSGDTLLISLFGTRFLAFKLPSQQKFQFIDKRIFTQRLTGAIVFFQYDLAIRTMQK